MATTLTEGFYQVTQEMYDWFIAREGINKVVVDVLSQADIEKQTVYGYIHIVPEQSVVRGSNNVYSFSIYCVDIVDLPNRDIRDMPNFQGIDNLQDVWHETDKHLTEFVSYIRRGRTQVQYQLDGDPVMTPFKDRFENLLAGWELSIDIIVPTGGPIC